MPDAWDFQVGDGEGGGSSSDATSIGTDPSIRPIDPYMHEILAWGYLPRLRFLSELFPELSDTAPSNSVQDAPLPFAVIEIEDGTYRAIDQLAETAGVLDRGPGTG